MDVVSHVALPATWLAQLPGLSLPTLIVSEAVLHLHLEGNLRSRETLESHFQFTPKMEITA